MFSKHQLLTIQDLQMRARQYGHPFTVDIGLLPTPYGMHALHLCSLQTGGDLCLLLKCSKQELEHLINHPAYHSYSIPKKKGGMREICAPAPALKAVQRRLNQYLQAYYYLIKPEAAQGFIGAQNKLDAPRNIVSNAAMHCGHAYVLNLDLRDFFPGIGTARLKQLFTSGCFGFGERMATYLSFLCTYKGSLPTGAPTSPVLSNLICLTLDKSLQAYSAQQQLVYSRYADDLSFSSQEPISEQQIRDIRDIIQSEGFQINAKKQRLLGKHRRQVVTGLTVNETPNVSRKLLKQVRAMLHHLNAPGGGSEAAARKHFKLQSPAGLKEQERFRARLLGYLNFISMVKGKDSPLVKNLMQQYRTAYPKPLELPRNPGDPSPTASAAGVNS